MSNTTSQKLSINSQSTNDKYFITIVLAILILPLLVYIALQFFVSNYTTSAFMAIALLVAMKVGLIVYILTSSSNQMKVKTD